jgi:hypothetical protein
VKATCRETFVEWEKQGKIDIADEMEKLMAKINVKCFIGEEGTRYTDQVF